MDNYINQRRAVYTLLTTKVLTRLQIARSLGIERASVCRRVAELKSADLLWVAKISIDPLSKQRAEFLTCNKALL